MRIRRGARLRVSVAWSAQDGYRDALDPLLIPAGNILSPSEASAPVPDRHTVLHARRRSRSWAVGLSVWQAALRRIPGDVFEELLVRVAEPESEDGSVELHDLWSVRKALAADLPETARAVRTIVPAERRPA